MALTVVSACAARSARLATAGRQLGRTGACWNRHLSLLVGLHSLRPDHRVSRRKEVAPTDCALDDSSHGG